LKQIQHFLLRLVVPSFLLVLWWTITSLRLISPLYLPSPLEVIQAARDVGPELGVHALATFVRLAIGFGSGVAMGYGLGLLMVLYGPIAFILGPVVDGGRPTPISATMPFFLLWFGFALYGQVLFIALGVMLIMSGAVLDASKAVSPHLIRVAQSFRASRWQLLRTVIMPGMLPQLVPTIRVCLGIAGSLTAVSEFMGADSGLGTLMELARRTLRTESLVLVSLVLAMLVLSCDFILRQYLSRRLTWMSSSTEALGVNYSDWRVQE